MSIEFTPKRQHHIRQIEYLFATQKNDGKPIWACRQKMVLP